MNIMIMNNTAFENSMMFVSAYFNIMSTKFKALREFRFDRTLLNCWRRDMKKEIDCENFVRIMKVYMFFLKLMGINEYSLINTIKLCLIQRLEACANE